MPGGIVLGQVALEVPHLFDVLLDLLLTVHVATAEAHADLGPVAAVVGTHQLGVHIHHFGMLLAGQFGALGLEVLEQFRAHVLAYLLQIVLVPGLLQGAIVIAGTGQETVHVKAWRQAEGDVAVGKAGRLRGTVALLELLRRCRRRLITRVGRLWLGRRRLVLAQGSEQEYATQCQQGDQQEVHALQAFEGAAAQQVGEQATGQQAAQQATHHAALLGRRGQSRILAIHGGCSRSRLSRCRLVALAKGFAATKFLGLGDGCPKANGQDHGKQGQHLFHFDSFTLM
ncbi:hypothetical protein D3C84_663500 [compost metagenome]